MGRGQLKCDGTRAETRFRLSCEMDSAGGHRFSRLLAAEARASAVVMLDTPCSEVVWRVLATHSIRQFPLHFPSRASPCAITFQLESITVRKAITLPGVCILKSAQWWGEISKGNSFRNRSNHEVRFQTCVFKRQNQTRLCMIILYWF